MQKDFNKFENQMSNDENNEQQNKSNLKVINISERNN